MPPDTPVTFGLLGIAAAGFTASSVFLYWLWGQFKNLKDEILVLVTKETEQAGHHQDQQKIKPLAQPETCSQDNQRQNHFVGDTKIAPDGEFEAREEDSQLAERVKSPAKTTEGYIWHKPRFQSLAKLPVG